MTPLNGAERHAQLVLKLLLGEAVPPAALAAVDWARLAQLAERNAVAIRVAEQLAALGLHPPAALAQAVERERGRARAALDLLPRQRQLARAVGERDWDAVARLGAWPAAALLRRLTRFLAQLGRPAASGRPAFWPATPEGRTP